MTGNGVGIATNGSINTATSESSLADVSERNGVELLLGLNLHFMSLYKVKDKLGQGSYGTVWTAHPIDNEDETYAVKIIDRTKLKKRESEAVYREVEILQALKGLPHVIPIIDFLAEPRTFYVVQLYAKGGDLFQRLTQRKVYTEKDARDIAITLLETLDSMHTKHSIVHRDLKPENLLLEDSETEKIYFADFGFARRVPKEGLKTKCGTPAFVAPEILLGRTYRQPVDMWSIGCIIFMMVGGYPPFQGDGGKNMSVLFRKIRAGDFTFHETLWGKVSVQCKRLISKLLTVNPDRRYTARQALDSQWIQESDGRGLSKTDLSQSLKSLKNFNGKLSLKGAMHAVKFAISANFWNPDAVTFSRQTNQIQITDQVINAALRSPSRISFSDEYELVRKIRKGSCATVWECEHKDTKEIFAVKIINRPKLKANDDEFVLNEVAIMQSLSQFSKYIVQLLDFYEEEDNFYLVMDYMGGGDVFDRILEKTKYTENDARMLTVVLLKAVRCIHSVGIAHRDLKPHNLLLTSTVNNAHIKITDFGFSRRVHAPQSLTSRCGTPTFVAPEILKNIPHDESVDMWSVGVIIYVLLVGYPPFLKGTQAELFQQIRSGDWNFCKKDWKDISKEAQELISGLLVVDPEQRWTVDEALSCAWIHQPEADLSTNDLSESLDMLRKRKSRLRKDMGMPVVWEHKGKNPIDAELQLQEPVRIVSF